MLIYLIAVNDYGWLNMDCWSIIIFPAIQSLLPHLEFLSQVLDMVTAFFLIHVTDVNAHLVLSLFLVHLHVLQLEVVVTDFIHEVGAA